MIIMDTISDKCYDIYMEKFISKLRRKQIEILDNLYFNRVEDSHEAYKTLERIELKIQNLSKRGYHEES